MKDFIAGIFADKRVVLAAATVAGALSILTIVYFLWPEASDCGMPGLRVEGILENYSYRDSASVSYYATEKETSLRSAEIKVDGEIVHREELAGSGYYNGANVDLTRFSEGQHLLAVCVTDSSFRQNSRGIEIPFFVDRTPPEIKIALTRKTAAQGDIGAIYLRASEPLSEVNVTMLGRSFFGDVVDAEKNIYLCFLPVSVFAPQAMAGIQVRVKDRAGNLFEAAANMAVYPQDFIKELIEVPQSKTALFVDNRALAREAELIWKMLATHTPDQIWSGAFIRPAGGHVSSPYGSQRVYTTGLVASYHRGMDIANPAGTPIHAANHGTVIVAAFFILYGNMVIIDHGQGVLTMYCHMEALVVKKGDSVVKGETIGFMGDTGLATGPHLHWELRISMCDANPLDLMHVNLENPWKGGE